MIMNTNTIANIELSESENEFCNLDMKLPRFSYN